MHHVPLRFFPDRGLLLSIAVIVVLSLCVAAAYAPMLGAGWAYDDLNLVQPSPALQDLTGLKRAVSTDLYRQAAPRLEASPYWRPLAMASFWLDTRFGAAPSALHRGNILLHVLAAALLMFAALRRQGGIVGVISAAAAAAWWALHPENAETVAWISCRYDLLCGFILLCLLTAPWRSGLHWAALSGLIFLAGLLSKEGFFMMAVVVAAMDFADHRPVRAMASRWVAIVLAIAIWMGLRAAVGVKSFDMPTPGAVLTMLRIYPEALVMYLWRALGATPLTISHPYMPDGALAVTAGIAIFAAFLAASIRWRRLAVPAAIFLAGLVPIVGAMALFHEAPERYFYVPSIGLALLIGELVALALAPLRAPGSVIEQQVKRFAGPVRVVVPAAVVIAILGSIVRLEGRLPDWQSNDTLWAAALRVSPLDPQANFNQAIAAGHHGDWDEALRAFEVAAHGDPNSGRIACAYAWALIRTGDFAGAAREADHAAAIAPYQPDCWYYLAFARHKAGDHAGELAAVNKLLDIAPGFPGAREMRAIATNEMSGRK